jgi:hypothetical protein
MQRSLGCHVEGYALPIPDAYWGPNKLGALLKRVGCEGPRKGKGSLTLFRELRSFTRALIRKEGLQPLVAEDVSSVKKWLEEESHYSGERQRELLEAYEKGGHVKWKHLKCRTFIKTETYCEFKYPRLINSRHDYFKCLTGPFFHAVERQVFQLKQFVKFVPVRDRPEYIWKMVQQQGAKYVATDYSSFEAWFVPEVLHAIEFQLYAYMAKRLPNRSFLIGLIALALGGKNMCSSGDLVYSVQGVRMSGDMCTSLGNGFTNYVLMRFICHKQGIACKGLVEGDDGIFAVSRVPDTDLLEQVGFKIKMGVSDTLGDAGFCKQYFDPSDFVAVVDARELLCKFGWTHAILRDGSPVIMEQLLRAKAASLRAEAPRCPIAVALVRLVERTIGLSGPKLYSGAGGERTWIEEARSIGGDAIAGNPTYASRLVMERVFHIPVATQIAVEEYLDSLRSIQPLRGPCIGLMRSEWGKYASRYVWRYAANVNRSW